MPSLEYQASNEIYAQVGYGKTSIGAYEDFIEYIKVKVYFTSLQGSPLVIRSLPLVTDYKP